ncbi:MAG TPA: cytochrome C oxidase subunit II [Bacilli bacterium]
MKKLLVCAMGLALVFTMSACGDKNDDNTAVDTNENAAPAAGEVAAPAGEMKEITFTATNYKFDQEEYKLAVGDIVKFTLDNQEGIHGVVIPELGINLDGGNLSQEVTLNKAGTYTIRCSVMCGTGHGSMKSTLIVE